MSPALALPDGLRWMDAGNAGPFTLEGTRTFLVGRSRVVVIDPGPDRRPEHLDALAAAVADADSVTVLVTHGHGDHSGGAPALARRLGVPVFGAWAGKGPPDGLDFRLLSDGEVVPTDAGDLVAVATPGHARAHLAFHWPAASAVFVGDLMLGQGETTWVGEYPGCVADYLASLDRVEGLGARLLLPTHGPAIDDPAERIQRYRSHRLERVAQVARALAAEPGLSAGELYQRVYGRAVPPDLAAAAYASLDALVDYARASGLGPGH